jgi:acetolactate decarboxylase
MALIPNLVLAMALLRTAALAGGTPGDSPNQPAAWDGRIEQWGAMREVLAEGKTEARINLAELTKKPHAYAVGALAGLEGEILVLDGRVLVSRGEKSTGQKTGSAEPKDVQAALLTAAYVPRWQDLEIDRDVPPGEVDDYLKERISKAGFAEEAVVPFLMQGEFINLKIHVVNKTCPHGATPGQPDTTYRAALLRRRGTALGFFAISGAGVYTHHDSKTHMHFSAADATMMAHVDQLGIKKGTVLRLPAR